MGSRRIRAMEESIFMKLLTGTPPVVSRSHIPNQVIVFRAYRPQSSLLERELIARKAYILARLVELKNPHLDRREKTLVYKSIWIERRIDRLKSELNS